MFRDRSEFGGTKSVLGRTTRLPRMIPVELVATPDDTNELLLEPEIDQKAMSIVSKYSLIMPDKHSRLRAMCEAEEGR